METLFPRCAGLDVHKNTVVACVRIQGPKGQATTETRTFKTHTAALLELLSWLEHNECTHVVMEATGVYWKPVWHILSGPFELVLANAKHVRTVPGRKSDVKDAEWLANLLAHGLVSASFVPDAPVQELRDLTRTRKQFVRQRAQHVNRIHKVLEDANIKLGSYVSDITGVSGCAILEALISGQTDPKKLAELANSRLKASPQDLALALEGKVTENHRFLLRLHLDQVQLTDRTVAQLDARIEEVARPFAEVVNRLVEMPGMSTTAAHVVLAEIGDDMSRFPTAGHLVSFAGLCPRLDESAGTRRSTRLRKGSTWLKSALVSCAWAATRSKDTYARAQYHRIKTRRGPKKAVVAVAASMLTAIYHVVHFNLPYRDLGPNHFDRRDRTRIANRLRRRLEELGYDVQLAPAA